MASEATRREQYQEYLRSPEWRRKRQEALLRAGHRCQICNSKRWLQVHHRTYDRVEREEPDDLTVLCKGCHETFHGRRTPSIPKPKGQKRKKKRTCNVCGRAQTKGGICGACKHAMKPGNSRRRLR